MLWALGASPLNAAPEVEPSNTAELAAKKTQPAYDPAADAKRKAAMSPEELAWETLLEQNLGSYYLPLYKQDKLAGRETAWDFVQDDPKLPRVLIIGDSISRGYTLAVRHALAGKANVHRAPANCGSTAMALKSLPVWLGSGHWDVIHFNFGIWDRGTPPAVYAKNLEQIAETLQTTGAKLIWARTTPSSGPANEEKYTPEACDNLNRCADDIMQKLGIPEDDLYAAVAPQLATLQLANSVHFTPAGYDVLGTQAAKAIQAQLDAPKTAGAGSGSVLPVAVEKDPRVQPHGSNWRFQQAANADPQRPRVLLIGDSILNGYLPLVIKGLDGKADVDAWVNPYCQSDNYNHLLSEALAKGVPYAVVHINMGLHGWEPGRIKPGTFEPLTRAYLEIIQQKCPQAKIIWANTTPVMIKGKSGQLDPVINPNIIEQNRMAAEVMGGMNLPVEDFYSLMMQHLALGTGDGFHWKQPAYKILADTAVQSIAQALSPAKGQP